MLISSLDQTQKIEQSVALLQKTFECPICLEVMINAVSTKCDHKFCRLCISETLGRKNVVPCPMCKEPITKRSLQKLPKWNQIVNKVRELVCAFQSDTGVQLSPPAGCHMPLSQGTPIKSRLADPDTPTRSCDLLRKRKSEGEDDVLIFIEEEAGTEPQHIVKSHINISSPFGQRSGKKRRIQPVGEENQLPSITDHDIITDMVPEEPSDVPNDGFALFSDPVPKTRKQTKPKGKPTLSKSKTSVSKLGRQRQQVKGALRGNARQRGRGRGRQKQGVEIVNLEEAEEDCEEDTPKVKVKNWLAENPDSVSPLVVTPLGESTSNKGASQNDNKMNIKESSKGSAQNELVGSGDKMNAEENPIPDIRGENCEEVTDNVAPGCGVDGDGGVVSAEVDMGCRGNESSSCDGPSLPSLPAANKHTHRIFRSRAKVGAASPDKTKTTLLPSQDPYSFIASQRTPKSKLKMRKRASKCGKKRDFEVIVFESPPKLTKATDGEDTDAVKVKKRSPANKTQSRTDHDGVDASSLAEMEVMADEISQAETFDLLLSQQFREMESEEQMKLAKEETKRSRKKNNKKGQGSHKGHIKGGSEVKGKLTDGKVNPTSTSNNTIQATDKALKGGCLVNHSYEGEGHGKVNKQCGDNSGKNPQESVKPEIGSPAVVNEPAPPQQKKARRNAKQEWASTKHMKKDLMKKGKVKKLELAEGAERDMPKTVTAERPSIVDVDTEAGMVAAAGGSDTDDMDIDSDISPLYEPPNLDIQPEDIKRRLSQATPGRGSVSGRVSVVPESTLDDRVRPPLPSSHLQTDLMSSDEDHDSSPPPPSSSPYTRPQRRTFMLCGTTPEGKSRPVPADPQTIDIDSIIAETAELIELAKEETESGGTESTEIPLPDLRSSDIIGCHGSVGDDDEVVSATTGASSEAARHLGDIIPDQARVVSNSVPKVLTVNEVERIIDEGGTIECVVTKPGASLAAEAGNDGHKAQQVDYKSSDIGDEPNDVGDESGLVGDKSSDVGDEPSFVGDRPGDEPNNVSDQPGDIGDEPHYVGGESGDEPSDVEDEVNLMEAYTWQDSIPLHTDQDNATVGLLACSTATSAFSPGLIDLVHDSTPPHTDTSDTVDVGATNAEVCEDVTPIRLQSQNRRQTRSLSRTPIQSQAKYNHNTPVQSQATNITPARSKTLTERKHAVKRLSQIRTSTGDNVASSALSPPSASSHEAGGGKVTPGSGQMSEGRRRSLRRTRSSQKQQLSTQGSAVGSRVTRSQKTPETQDEVTEGYGPSLDLFTERDVDNVGNASHNASPEKVSLKAYSCRSVEASHSRKPQTQESTSQESESILGPQLSPIKPLPLDEDTKLDLMLKELKNSANKKPDKNQDKVKVQRYTELSSDSECDLNPDVHVVKSRSKRAAVAGGDNALTPSPSIHQDDSEEVCRRSRRRRPVRRALIDDSTDEDDDGDDVDDKDDGDVGDDAADEDDTEDVDDTTVMNRTSSCSSQSLSEVLDTQHKELVEKDCKHLKAEIALWEARLAGHKPASSAVTHLSSDDSSDGSVGPRRRRSRRCRIESDDSDQGDSDISSVESPPPRSHQRRGRSRSVKCEDDVVEAAVRCGEDEEDGTEVGGSSGVTHERSAVAESGQETLDVGGVTDGNHAVYSDDDLFDEECENDEDGIGSVGGHDENKANPVGEAVNSGGLEHTDELIKASLEHISETPQKCSTSTHDPSCQSNDLQLDGHGTQRPAQFSKVKVKDEATPIASCPPSALPSRPNWSLVSSGIRKHQQQTVTTLCQALGCSFQSRFSTETTHVLVKPVEEGSLRCLRTLKYFQGIAGRVWVLSIQWAIDCMDQGVLLPEDDYEIQGDSVEATDHFGPQNARLSTLPLLKHFAICCLGTFTDLSRDDMGSLVQWCGGQYVGNPAQFSRLQDVSHRIIILEAADSLKMEHLTRLQKQHRAKVVIKEWLLDSIGMYDIRPLDLYLLPA